MGLSATAVLTVILVLLYECSLSPPSHPQPAAAISPGPLLSANLYSLTTPTLGTDPGLYHCILVSADILSFCGLPVRAPPFAMPPTPWGPCFLEQTGCPSSFPQLLSLFAWPISVPLCHPLTGRSTLYQKTHSHTTLS